MSKSLSRKKPAARKRTVILNQSWNELFDPRLPASKDANPEFVYRVERCTNVMCVAISEMLTPSKVEQLFSKGIDIVIKPKDRLKPLTGDLVMAEKTMTVPEAAEEEQKAPPKKPLSWSQETHDGVKHTVALGEETGNVYKIVPSTGGKFNLLVDGTQHNGRGSISHLQKYAQNMEDNLQTAEAKDIPEESAEPAKEPTPEPAKAAPAPAPAKTEAKLKPMEDGLPKAPATTIATPAASNVVYSSPPSTQTSDQGSKRPPTRPGQHNPGESSLFNSLRRCVLLFRIADNPANNGDLTATSWVSEITHKPDDSPIIAALARDKAISIEGEDTANLYCYLTDKGIEEYKAAKKALDECKLQLGLANHAIPPSPNFVLVDCIGEKDSQPPPLRGKEVVKKVTQLRYLPVGTTFMFPNPHPHESAKVGRILRKNGDSEVKVRYYVDGKFKNVQFIAPGTEVWPGGFIPEDAELDDLVIGGKKVGAEVATGKEEAPKPKPAPAAAPEEKKKVTVKPAEVEDDEDDEDQEGSFEVETDAGNITVEVQGPKEEGGKQRIRIMGYSVTAIIRWMGADAWTFKRARRALKRLGLEVAKTTIVSQMASGRNGENGKRGEVPELTAKQEKKLYALLKKPVEKTDDEE